MVTFGLLFADSLPRSGSVATRKFPVFYIMTNRESSAQWEPRQKRKALNRELKTKVGCGRSGTLNFCIKQWGVTYYCTIHFKV